MHFPLLFSNRAAKCILSTGKERRGYIAQPPVARSCQRDMNGSDVDNFMVMPLKGRDMLSTPLSFSLTGTAAAVDGGV